MQAIFMVGDEPIPGYRLTEKLGGTAFFRLWKVQAPDGSFKLWKEIDLIVGNAAIETRTLGLLVQLRHPYLNTLTNFWQLDEGRTLVVETAVPLMTLRQRANQRGESPITIQEALRYIKHAAEGLDFLNSPCHDFNGQKVAIYHRALTLDSLLLFQEDDQFVCKVSDFGLAKPVTEQTTANSQGLQNYDYDPPEFFEGRTTATSDQYSLAINYFELRTGRLPFSTGSMLDQLQAKMTDRPSLDPLVDPERSAVRKALASDPASRYPSCLAFVEAVEAAASGVAAAMPAPMTPTARLAGAPMPSAERPTPRPVPEPAAAPTPGIAASAGTAPAPTPSAAPARSTSAVEELTPPPRPVRQSAQDVVAALRGEKAAAPSPRSAPKPAPAPEPSKSTMEDVFGAGGEKKVPVLWAIVLLGLTALFVFFLLQYL